MINESYSAIQNTTDIFNVVNTSFLLSSNQYTDRSFVGDELIVEGNTQLRGDFTTVNGIQQNNGDVRINGSLELVQTINNQLSIDGGKMIITNTPSGQNSITTDSHILTNGDIFATSGTIECGTIRSVNSALLEKGFVSIKDPLIVVQWVTGGGDSILTPKLSNSGGKISVSLPGPAYPTTGSIIEINMPNASNVTSSMTTTIGSNDPYNPVVGIASPAIENGAVFLYLSFSIAPTIPAQAFTIFINHSFIIE